MVLNKLKRSRGVTLIELIIVIAILGIVMVGVYNFLFYGANIFQKASTTSEFQQDVNQSAYHISNNIRNVKKISLTDKPGYTPLNIQIKYPSITSVEYRIIKDGENFSLKFKIIGQGHSIESKIILNNVKSADTNGLSQNIWYVK